MLKKQLRNGDSIHIAWPDGRTGIITAKARSVLVIHFPSNVVITDIKRENLQGLIINNQNSGG